MRVLIGSESSRAIRKLVMKTHKVCSKEDHLRDYNSVCLSSSTARTSGARTWAQEHSIPLTCGCSSTLSPHSVCTCKILGLYFKLSTM